MRRVWNRLFNLTGFRGKTLWDCIGLLIVPLFIAGATLVFSYFELERQDDREQRDKLFAKAQQEREQEFAERQRQREEEFAQAQQEREEQLAQVQQQIEDDGRQHTVLRSYLLDMTDLMINKELLDKETDDPVRIIANSTTHTALIQLNGERKAILLKFISQTELVKRILDPLAYPLASPQSSIISLNQANLLGAQLSNANLDNTNLEGANLNQADLNQADLNQADLNQADLSNADLSNANLRSANLSNANLQGAEGLTNEQLAQAESLVGATLPDGTVIRTEEDSEEFKMRNR